MPKYKVEVHVLLEASAEIEVEAPNEDKAGSPARKQAKTGQIEAGEWDISGVESVDYVVVGDEVE